MEFEILLKIECDPNKNLQKSLAKDFCIVCETLINFITSPVDQNMPPVIKIYTMIDNI